MDQNTENITSKTKLAQALEAGLTLTLTLSQSEITPTNATTPQPGQPVLCAPEQMSNGKTGPHTHAFHIGLYLHSLLTGHPLLFNEFLGFTLEVYPIDSPQIKRILEKLLAYCILDRYSCLNSIAKDLSTCLEHLQHSETIPYFPLDNTRSVNQLWAYHLNDPHDVAQFQTTWATTQKNQFCVTIIEGHPGVGKTSTIHQTVQPMVGPSFTYGKCTSIPEQPYQAILSILDQAIKSQKITPQIQSLLAQLNAPELESGTSFMNFHRTVIQLFEHLTQTKPIVICLDDLQWADQGTLTLIETLATRHTNLSLWLIFSFRSNEKSSQLSQLIQTITTQVPHTNHVAIHPFDTRKLTQFLNEYFRFANPEELSTYTTQLILKTGGTPFFIKQFLMDQIEKNYLSHNENQDLWTWNTLELEHTPIMDNAAHLVSAKATTLPNSTIRTLSIAAMTGSAFSLKLLANVLEKNEMEIALALWPAIQIHFIVPVADNNYRFLHDTIHATFLDTIPLNEKPIWHFKIARTMDILGNYSIFELANHYNAASSQEWNATLRRQIAKINLKAGQDSLQKAAFGVAVNFFKQGLSLIQPLGWNFDYQLMFDFHLSMGKALFLSDKDQNPQHYFKTAIDHAKDKTAILKIAIVQVELFHHGENYEEAIFWANKASSAHKTPIKISPFNKLHILLEYRKIKKNYISKPFTHTPLPICSDDHEQYLQHIASATLTCLYFIDVHAFVYLTLRVFQKVLSQGETPYSQCILASSVIFLMHGSKDYNFAVTISELILSSTNANPETRTIALCLLGSYSLPYYRSLNECIQVLEEAKQIGSTKGNILFANYANNFVCFFKFILDTPLPQLNVELQNYLQFTQQTRERWSERYTTSFITMVHRLQNTIPKEDLLNPDTTAWILVQKRLKDKKQYLSIVTDSLFEAIPFYLEGDFNNSRRILEKALPYLKYVLGIIHNLIIEWLYALSLLGNYPSLTTWDQFKTRRHIHKASAHFKHLVQQSPDNFRVLHLILETKKNTVLLKNPSSPWEYQNIITIAENNNNLFYALIAADLAANEPHLPLEKRAHFQTERKRIAKMWGLHPTFYT